MTDPYQVLGVSPTASDDEVKKAYRTLCKKYHPDANVGKPDAAQAEKKFMEVQQAYEEIMHRRQGGGQRAGSGYNGGAQQQRQPQPDDPFASFWGAYGGNPYGNAGYGGYSSAGYGQAQQDDSIEMRAAKNYIDTGHYAEALNALGSVPPESETLAGIFSARWRRAACIIMRRQWNMRGRPQAWSRATCSISSCSASFRAAAAGTASRDRNMAAEPAGMNSVCTTFMLLNLCCACCGGGRMMYAPLFCCI